MKTKKLSPSARQLCDSCSKPAIVRYTIRDGRLIHAYACSDHQSRAKQMLKGGW